MGDSLPLTVDGFLPQAKKRKNSIDFLSLLDTGMCCLSQLSGWIIVDFYFPVGFNDQIEPDKDEEERLEVNCIYKLCSGLLLCHYHN